MSTIIIIVLLLLILVSLNRQHPDPWPIKREMRALFYIFAIVAGVITVLYAAIWAVTQ
jgi:hypothetical protein